jgi:hypothetical protein
MDKYGINKFNKNNLKDNIGLTETNLLIRNHKKIKNGVNL